MNSKVEATLIREMLMSRNVWRVSGQEMDELITDAMFVGCVSRQLAVP